MADRDDLIFRTLRNLGVLPMGQTPSAEERESIDDILDWTIADLTLRNIIRNVSADFPDDDFIIPLANIVAWRAASEFGQGKDAGLAALAFQAEQQLKEPMTASTATSIVRP